MALGFLVSTKVGSATYHWYNIL